MNELVAELVASALAHRACCMTEHNPKEGKLHGCCVVCGVPWPCETASRFLSLPGAEGTAGVVVPPEIAYSFDEWAEHTFSTSAYVGEFRQCWDAAQSAAHQNWNSDAKVLIKRLRSALNGLINQYWANKGNKSCEFISCITINHIPEYWREADEAAQMFPHLGR